jgi:DNA processing protein
VLDGPRVAVVGTRRCTRYGRDVAFELGRDLAARGVAVVSGLALGIDASAHAGALEAGGRPPVAVVATGLDVVYPRRNGPLWRQVAARGLLLSEYPLGVPPLPWRFPARNRLVAALADVLVVVESHARGGSLYTVEEAARRDRPVMAVPGSVRSAASRGALDLLADGCPPVRDVDDVLTALGLSSRVVGDGPDPVPGPLPGGTSLDDGQLAVLDALGDEPATLEHLAVRTGQPMEQLAGALYHLGGLGVVVEEAGWYERVHPSSSRASERT